MLRLLTLIVALCGPYLIVALFEWQMHPGEWAWWSRLALALVFAFYLYLLLAALYHAGADAVRRPAPVRKEQEFGDI